MRVARWRRRMPRRMRVMRRAWSCGGVGIEHGAQRNRLADLHEHVAAVDQHREELARARGQGPVLREQQPQPRAFLLRRAAPVHRGGHQQQVAHRVAAQFLDHREQVRWRAARMGRVPEAAAAPDVEKRAALFHRQARRALLRVRQAQPLGHIAQHGEIGQRVALEHIADGRGRRGQRRRGLGRLHRRPHPEPEESTQQPSHHCESGPSMMLGGRA